MYRRAVFGFLIGLILGLVSACSGSGDPVQRPAPASIAKFSGDAQTARPGSETAMAQVIQVLDSLAAPVEGVEVEFTAIAGGGRVRVARALTDSRGLASSGGWTLGPARGVNQLTARVAALDPARFTALGGQRSSDVAVTVLRPAMGALVDEAMAIAVTVNSTYQVTSAAASAGPASTTLSFGSDAPGGQNAWRGTLRLTSVPRGTVEFVVAITDALGNVSEVLSSATLDRAPSVSVAAPLEGSLARPLTRITAQCNDDDAAGCRSIVASVNGTVVARGTVALDQPLDLSADEGRQTTLSIAATDSAGQVTTVTRGLFVDSSASLVTRAEVGGPVWDVLDTRVLYLDMSQPTPALRVLDTSTGVVQTVFSSTDLTLSVGYGESYGYLTPSGAVFASAGNGAAQPYAWIYEWRSGQLSRVDGTNAASRSLRVAGSWAIYSSADPVSRNPNTGLWRRHLDTGVSTLVQTGAAEFGNDVAANGDVVYQWAAFGSTSGQLNIYRWRAGVAVPLTSDASPGLINTDPVTAGTRVVYRKATVRAAAPGPFGVVLTDGSSETLLTPAAANAPGSELSHALSTAHAAYVRDDVSGARQVWRLGPTGSEQLSFFSSASLLEGLAADGSTVFSRSTPSRRFMARPGRAAQECCSALGKVLVRDPRVYVIMGRTVLELN